MDRLTRRMCGGWGLVEGCELNTPGGMRRVVERLAAYENAGITPEVAAMYAKYHDNRGSVIPDLDELATFRKAQAEGRIVVIPKASKGFKPLVDNAPQDNVSTALNLFYVKDGWTWVRGGGPGPDYADVSLCDYIRQIAKEHGLDIAQSDDDDSISLEMSELLFDGTDTIEGVVATLYTAGWAFAELRERLKAYEETGLTPEEIVDFRENYRIAIAKFADYKAADMQRQLVVLPCKVGDTVYATFRLCGDYLREKNKPYPCEVVFIGISNEPFMHIQFENGRVFPVGFEKIGETVFTTKEAAEAALKESEETHGV